MTGVQTCALPISGNSGNGASGASGGADGSGPASGPATAYGRGGVDGTVPDVDLATLGDHLGDLVRVGGLLVAVTADGFTLDDGTAVGAIRLDGPATAFHDLLEVGDALGLVGRVELEAGEYRVVVGDPAGLVRLGDLGEIVPIAATATSAPVDPGPPVGATSAGLGGTLGVGELPGFLGLLLISMTSLGLTIARRRHAHRRLVAVVAARIGTLRGADDGPGRTR